MTSILSGLDFYKLTMSQQAWKIARDAEVTFTLKNRNKSQNILSMVSVETLMNVLYRFNLRGFTDSDISYLSSLGIFETAYLKDLRLGVLPTPLIGERDGELHVHVTGPWWLVTFWETVIMSTINDLYFAGRWAGFHTEGHNILSEKIRVLRMYPEIRFSDFGTRRRFGLGWQGQVIQRLKDELPGQFLGTSNPYFAQQIDMRPIGTFAHELPMVYAAMEGTSSAELTESHDRMLNDWYESYGESLSIALTDTFGSEFFFRTFGEQRAHAWKGLRHDSGDPFEFGERTIQFYEGHGIDPRTKTLIFSDGLDLDKILALHERFGSRLNVMYGWGTGLTNDVQQQPLNIVMKATSVNGIGTVKLSDDKGKHTGSPEDVARYLEMTKVLT